MRRWQTLLRDLAARLPGGRRLKAELDHAERQRGLLQSKLVDVEADRGRLRERASEAERRIAHLRARFVRQRTQSSARLEGLRQQAATQMLDERVLAQVLPVRHAALLASDRTARAASEAAFIGRSESYRAIRALDTEPPEATRVTLDGLHWWIPDTVPQPGGAGIAGRLLGKGRLPLEEILQGRELAVGRVMIDIGANIGTTSITRVVLGDVERVYAAEPDPVNYACLVRNVVENGVQGLVLPDCVAIGDANGDMQMERSHSGTHHLLASAPSARRDVVQVPCWTLDAWVARLHIDLSQVTFVKADTQGWDIRVLLGASHVLRHRHIAWQIEFSPSMLRRAKCDTTMAYEVIRAHFTHVIDLRSHRGPRVRRTSELLELFANVEAGERPFTNLLLFNAAH